LEQVQANQLNNYLYVVENYNNICYNVNECKSKYRSANDIVEIMAVTKTVLPEAVNVAISSGVTLLGENKVQEFMLKKDKYDKNAQVHFIGHLQSNKVKYIVENVSMIQSVDNLKLAKEINKQLNKINKTMSVLIEINIANEPSKSGVDINELEDLLYNVSLLENLNVKGLMAIPPKNAKETIFENMHKIFIDIYSKKMDNINMSILSMGMSNDYEMAIKHGSNLVRIGTGLFGARNYSGGI